MYKPLFLATFETELGIEKGQFKSRECAEKYAQAKVNYEGIPCKMRESFAYNDEWFVFQPVNRQ